MKKQIISLSVLPGQPTDGTGKLCTHLFIRNPKGTINNCHMATIVIDKETQRKTVKILPACGCLACNHSKNPMSYVNKHGVVIVTMRTDDPRAVTCPKCKETEEYKQGILSIGEIKWQQR